jgi:MoxR-like ATPase
VFLESCEGDRLRVGEVILRRRSGPRSPLCPALASFASFCVDDTTASTLQHLALSVALREPCLLEGETSTSKTSSILYLAALLGMPVVRLSLNGQTDTGELVGGFRPETAAPAEGQPSRTWRWTDGAVVQAMRQGHWLVLDEANLAEPQILERLNALLERTPSFVLSEHDNHVFGPGGESIHPDFRVFATMNPGEYAGRSPLSPAFRDRWRGYRFVGSPTEDDIVAMLELLATGQQPTVVLDGLRYERAMGEVTHPALTTLPDPTEQLIALARLHACAERALAETGERRGDRRVLTRRALLSVVDFVEAAPFGEGEHAADRALRVAVQRYYVASAGSEDLRKALAALVEAGGLGGITSQGADVSQRAGVSEATTEAVSAEEHAASRELREVLATVAAELAEIDAT